MPTSVDPRLEQPMLDQLLISETDAYKNAKRLLACRLTQPDAFSRMIQLKYRVGQEFFTLPDHIQALISAFQPTPIVTYGYGMCGHLGHRCCMRDDNIMCLNCQRKICFGHVFSPVMRVIDERCAFRQFCPRTTFVGYCLACLAHS